MTIQYATSNEFYEGIYACVERGLTFEADHDALVITLTGGF